VEETIRIFLQDYFQHLNAHNKDATLKDWHPQGMLFINGKPRPLAFLQGLPTVVSFEVRQVERIDVTGSAASAVVFWTMNLPGSTGHHVSHFGLVNAGENWRIVSQVDYGVEETR
jgi:hypothetical protein